MKIFWANLKSSSTNKNNESVKGLFLAFIKVSRIIMREGGGTGKILTLIILVILFLTIMLYKTLTLDHTFVWLIIFRHIVVYRLKIKIFIRSMEQMLSDCITHPRRRSKLPIVS